MIATWCKTYIRRFGKEMKNKKVSCNHRPKRMFIEKHASLTALHLLTVMTVNFFTNFIGE